MTKSRLGETGSGIIKKHPNLGSLKQNLHNLMSQHSVELVLQWIPGHIGIKGSEAADVLAKRGAALSQPNIHVVYETAGPANQNKHPRRLTK